MKSLKDFKSGLIIHKVDIKRAKSSQFFGEITIKASPPIYKENLYSSYPFFGRIRKILAVLGIAESNITKIHGA